MTSRAASTNIYIWAMVFILVLFIAYISYRSVKEGLATPDTRIDITQATLAAPPPVEAAPAPVAVAPVAAPVEAAPIATQDNTRIGMTQTTLAVPPPIVSMPVAAPAVAAPAVAAPAVAAPLAAAPVAAPAVAAPAVAAPVFIDPADNSGIFPNPVEQTTAFSTAPSNNSISSIFGPTTPASFTILGSAEIPNVSTAVSTAVSTTTTQALAEAAKQAEILEAATDVTQLTFQRRSNTIDKAAAQRAIFKAAADQAIADKAAADKTATDKAAADKAIADRIADAERAAVQQVANEKAAANKALLDKQNARIAAYWARARAIEAENLAAVGLADRMNAEQAIADKALAAKKAAEEAARRAAEEAARRAAEEAARKAQEDADRKAQEDADRKAKEDADRKAREDADRKAKENPMKIPPNIFADDRDMVFNPEDWTELPDERQPPRKKKSGCSIQ